MATPSVLIVLPKAKPDDPVKSAAWDKAWTAARALNPICDEAVAALTDAGAFKGRLPTSIDIALGFGAVTDMITPAPQQPIGAPVWVGPLRIGLGCYLLEPGGEAAKLVALGAAPKLAVAFILAHEVRHLDERRRENACGAPLGEVKFFGGALDPRLPQDVIDALRLAARTYDPVAREAMVGYPRISIEAARAHDVAVELRADLEAKILLTRANLWTPQLEAAVIAARAADEVNQPPKHYLIGTEWPALSACADEDEASVRTIERCVDLLINSPNIDPAVAAAAAAVQLPVALSPARAAPKTLIDRLLRR